MSTTAPDSFAELYRQAPCGLLTMSEDGVVLTTNDTLVDWLGMAAEELIGSRFQDHLDPGSRLFYETRHTPVLRLQGEVREVALTLVRGDGTKLPILMNSIVREAVVHSAVFDSTARHEYEQDLLVSRRSAQASEVRVRVLQEASAQFAVSLMESEVAAALASIADQAFDATASGVFVLDADGTLELMGGTNPLDAHIPVGSQPASERALMEQETIVVDADDEGFSFVTAGLRATNLECVHIVPLLRGGVPLGVLACFYARRPLIEPALADLQAALARLAAQTLVRIRLQQELAHLALYDQLTGLVNRKLLQETVTTTVDNTIRSGRPMAVIFLDLDGFKGVNDRLGHATGDEVLVEVAARIRAEVRHEDTVGRFGGDEFVVVCEDADDAAASSIADRIRAGVRAPYKGVPDALAVSASVGVVIYTPGSASPPTNDELLDLADNAMYHSKDSGKDRVSFLSR